MAAAHGSRPDSSTATRIWFMPANRADEFEMRLAGASYEDIAQAGGGIASTVRATRAASEDELVAQSAVRLQPPGRRGRHHGRDQVRLRARHRERAQDAARRPAPGDRRAESRSRTTFLGAHALPPEFAGRADDYIALVCDEMLPAAAAAQLADAVDAFCERIAFHAGADRARIRCRQSASIAGQAARRPAFRSGRRPARGRISRPVRRSPGVCVEQHRCGRWPTPAPSAVVLPGAFYFLRETRLPPIASLRQHGVPIAIATDCNPGTSPCTSLLLMLNMACTLVRPHARGSACRGHAECGQRARHRERSRQAGTGPARRFRALGHRAPGRARLCVRRESLRRASRAGRGDGASDSRVR